MNQKEKQRLSDESNQKFGKFAVEIDKEIETARKNKDYNKVSNLRKAFYYANDKRIQELNKRLNM